MRTYTVEVEGFEPFAIDEGAKLALAIERAGIDISHRCGGNARCTTCRVAFLSKEPPMGAKEHDCLEEDGVLGEFRLSCQIRADRDMRVRVLMRASEQGWDPGVELEP
ncbi:MAG: (2Fe-2S)-binding protein [Fimbriimonas ginsengisoli]|uniref:(2Fe-2S)-binding protein n=1 Tax=Fimbriimonas ginsengisoli TaxID=1005039 RepID=A0A931LXB7_FIMGI|nr:(2Fe-2S)-binding protein [Fimbriimonas ginsengisoli]MBI3722118.1 (2Fe-2S)-binding protein [Fimbriimonas ginsengisoli]